MRNKRLIVIVKKFIPIILLVLSVSSCATTAKYEAILKTWVGSHADDLVRSWGPPQRSYRLSDGSIVLEYSNQRSVQLGGYTYSSPQTTYDYGTINTYGDVNAYGTYSGQSTTYVTKTTPTYNINLSCVTRFTTNANGIITHWQWQGNNCKSK